MKQHTITDWSNVGIVIDLAFAARILGVTPESLKKRAQKKGDSFGAFKCGNLWRVEKTAFRRYIEQGGDKS